MLDGCLQVAATCGAETDLGEEVYVPFAVEGLHLGCDLPRQFYCHARRRDDTGQARPETLVSDLWLFDDAGRPAFALW